MTSGINMADCDPPDFLNIVEHFFNKEEAEAWLRDEKLKYIDTYWGDCKSRPSIDEFEEMISNGKLRELIYGDVEMEPEPFEYRMYEVGPGVCRAGNLHVG
jgi:hypothetical protein